MAINVHLEFDYIEILDTNNIYWARLFSIFMIKSYHQQFIWMLI